MTKSPMIESGRGPCSWQHASTINCAISFASWVVRRGPATRTNPWDSNCIALSVGSVTSLGYCPTVSEASGYLA
jgi:hypothetical protein